LSRLELSLYLLKIPPEDGRKRLIFCLYIK
jgi:hypothetical protein